MKLSCNEATSVNGNSTTKVYFSYLICMLFMQAPSGFHVYIPFTSFTCMDIYLYVHYDMCCFHALHAFCHIFCVQQVVRVDVSMESALLQRIAPVIWDGQDLRATQVLYPVRFSLPHFTY